MCLHSCDLVYLCSAVAMEHLRTVCICVCVDLSTYVKMTNLYVATF